MPDLNLTRDECARRSTELRVLDYTVRLDLRNAGDPEQATFDSISTVRFAASTVTSWIDIVAQDLVAATLNGAALDVSGYDGARLPLPGLAPDNELVVHARPLYSRTGEGLHRFTDPSDDATYLYTHFEPTESRRMFAVFEQPDLKAHFTFTVIADAGWLIRSGQPEVSRREYDGLAEVVFAPTPPQSSYITAIAAGPYHLATDEWSVQRADGRRLTVALGVLCRASMAPHLDAEDIFTVTRQGLSYFDDLFAFPYPWGKYDQIFVPEYNIGAMENPGLVTFTESYLHRGTATIADLTSRSEVILHEMAHMWFGDLATMRWWDGLWLKESFADLMGYQASTEATRYTSGLTMFAIGRKQWAYTQDQRPTTHPIAADIPDIEAAAQNFDGITYSKGAAALRQLQAYVGREAFDEGVRGYFAAHAWGSTELADFLAPLAAASGRDLGNWADTWLRTSGPSQLNVTVAERDSRTTLTLRQTMPAGSAPEDLRTHVFGVGLYADRDGVLTQLSRVPVEITDEATLDLAGTAPDLVLPNDDDATYAIVRLDLASRQSAQRSVSTMQSQLARALLWSALWNHTRDAQLGAEEFLDTVHSQLPSERDPLLVDAVLSMARTAVAGYLTGERQEHHAGRLSRLAHSRIGETDGDEAMIWAGALASFGAMTATAAPLIQPFLDPTATGSGPATDLPADPELRWELITALAATGSRTVAGLESDLSADFTMSGRRAYERAVASLPTQQAKATSWDILTGVSDIHLTNDGQRALIVGFRQPASGGLAAAFAPRYFEILEQLWATQSQSMAMRFVTGLFPAPETGSTLDTDRVIVAARDWLDQHTAAPAALRRGVIEGLDDAERILRVRAFDAS
ncbi:aminopeptidase N [Dermatophilaceae bacterium Sec6.4]